MSRTRSSMYNLVYAMIGQGLGVVMSFISRIVFVKCLDKNFLGINGLFTNILSILSLAELGIGTAIIYSLYKPLSEKDNHKCLMLMQFYKKVYTIIGVIIMVVGMCIIPLLPFLIRDVSDIQNLNLIYILFVLNTAISYFYSYKRNLIIADQNRYIATIYRYGIYCIVTFVQIFYLLIFKDYIGYLVIQILFTMIENILISKKADKMYPYLKSREHIELDVKIKDDIFTKTKAMIFHKLGSVVVNSTDNILLSSFVNIASVGLYSNYSLIIYALETIISQVYSSITASVGNLCANSSLKKEYRIYKNIDFMTFWIYCFSSVSLFILANPFIKLWLGDNFTFGLDILLVLTINFYLKGMRNSNLVFREATGLFEKDKWKAIIEAVINLVASIILVKKCGIIGVFLGTMISSITTCVWVEPYILYKYEFKMNPKEYFLNYFKKLLLFIFMMIFMFYLCNFIQLNIYLTFLIRGLLCLIIPNSILYLCYKNSSEFKYFYNNILRKIIVKMKRAIPIH